MRWAIAILVVARAAAADPVEVEVIDIAGDTAYVTPGRDAGLGPGAQVTIAGKTYRVAEATAKHAALAGGGGLAIGAAGTADATPPPARLPPPRPASAFRDQWPPAAPPAAAQQPAAIPLGEAPIGAAGHLALSATLSGAAARDGTTGELDARAIGSFTASHERPLGGDLDATVRFYRDGWNAHERTPLFVTAAQLRYGDAADPTLAIGRLRYAASSLGMLDGGRAALHTGDLELAAFGGIVPDPISGKPDTSASRFGAELVYDAASSPWQPRVAITAHGSTWDGTLDERVLSVTASASRGATYLDGWVEAQQFPAGNPWNAPAVDITGAGASGEWRHGGDHVGLDVTFLRPERSLRIESVVGDDFTCARKPLPGDVDEPCAGDDYWVAATASAGLRRGQWALDAVGSIGDSQGIAAGADASGYLRGEYGPRALRGVVAISGGHESFADWIATDLGVAFAPSRRLEGDLVYRPERLDYVAATGADFMQSIVADVHWAVSAAADLAISAVGTTGADRDVIQLITTIAWRPR
ncbi:MAG TPA: hypothetical protein VLX92_04190 [Kofleriaceae bacterium]|nr:hypothetical protein [Kofleriaceae bacterium]